MQLMTFRPLNFVMALYPTSVFPLFEFCRKNALENYCQVQSQTETKCSIIKDSYRKELRFISIAWHNRMVGNISIKK